MPTPVIGPLPRIGALESLRGIAAVIVVLSHMPGWHPAIHAVPLIRNGPLMVDFFFVLSGFVICRTYDGRIAGWNDVAAFQLKRLGRLYPVHLVFVGIYLAFEIARLLASGALHRPPATAPFAINSPVALVLQLLLVQSFAPLRYWTSFNAPAWSISVEFYCYLVFAVVSLCSGKWRAGAFALLFVAAFVSIAVGQPIGNIAVARCLAGFFLGALTALAARAQVPLPAIAQPLALAGVFGFAACVPADVVGGHLGMILLTPPLILALTARPGDAVSRALHWPPLLALGRWSYSIYMSHAFFILLAAQVVARSPTRVMRVIDGTAIPQLPLAVAAALQLALLATVILVSRYCYEHLENPARRWSRRTVDRAFGPAPGAATVTR